MADPSLLNISALEYFTWLLDPVGTDRDDLQVDVKMATADAYLRPPIFRRSCEIQEQLRGLYDEYVTTVSNDRSTASLRCIGLLCALGEATNASRILDLGSGFSSAALRTILPGAHIVSVDHDLEWLEKTGTFLERREIDKANLVSWRHLRKKRKDQRFDLVFDDLGGGIDYRAKTLPLVSSFVAERGILLIDDVHKPEMLTAALGLYAKRQFDRVGPELWTLDQYGRYSWVLRRRE